MQETDNPFSEAFGKAVDLGNRIADTDDKADRKSTRLNSSH